MAPGVELTSITTPSDHYAFALPLLRLALEAGNAIMTVYRSDDFEAESKPDDSPLTRADREAHLIIDAGLRQIAPHLPVMSEEGVHAPFSERRRWDEFWLVDPLDGTKEFIQRNGEFTVNIALIQHGEPVLGVIYAPDRDDAWVGVSGKPREQTDVLSRAWKLERASTLTITPTAVGAVDAVTHPLGSLAPHAILIRVCDRDPERITIIASRTHLNDPTRDLIARVGDGYAAVEIVNVGSSLKLCTLAEGLADLYPRYAPTSEWDIAAGHAIVRGAGGEIYQAGPDADDPPDAHEPVVANEGHRRFGHTSTPLRYNKENLLNPWFVVRAWE